MPDDVAAGDLGFSYRAHKNGTIGWHGAHGGRAKVAATLAGKEAARFLAHVAGTDAARAQQVMARATGNFKRGNERQPGRPWPFVVRRDRRAGISAGPRGVLR